VSAKSRFRLGLLAAIAIAGIVIAWFGREPFHRWQERRLVEKARGFLKTGDFRSAYLSSREALLKNPGSIAACSIAAQVADLEQSPAAILWRQKIAELQPGGSGPLIELAAAAIRFAETSIAEQALAQVRESDRDTVAFRQISASLAIALKQFGTAEVEFQKALELEPGNEGLQLNLATIRLGLARPGQTEQARAVLDALRARPQFHQEALRAMISDARRRGDSSQAMQLACELRQDARATFGDQLMYLEELQHAESKDFTPELSKLQASAVARPDIAYGLMTWMNAHGLVAQSIAWCETLPAKIRTQIPVPLAEAEARTALADWKQLREIVRDADWGDLEFLRFALHARVLYETDGQKRRSEFQLMWERAKTATRGNPEALVMLGRLVNGWGWKQEACEVWWLAAGKGPGNRGALKALYTLHSADKNTRELYRVVRRVLEMEPASPVAKNNVAALALALGVDEPEARRIAEENYRLTPTQPVIATTYAFSLHRQNRTSEALAILKRLPTAALADPSISACYGVLLAANGEAGVARPYLEAADRQKAQLFPEEVALVANALKGLP
jgi:predicted Zn-dependent protease